MQNHEMPPEEIGGTLAREFLHAQWMRIQLGLDANAPLVDLDLWCPQQRVSFRLPPWWRDFGATIDDDATLGEIYRGFANHLIAARRRSDDPEMNKSITVALAHVGVVAVEDRGSRCAV